MFGNDGWTKLLLKCEGADGSTTFTDSSYIGRTVTTSGPEVDTAQFKFGSASGLWSGATHRLTCVDSDDWFLDDGVNTNKWTIDFWVRFSSVTNKRGFIEHVTDSSNFWSIYWSDSTNELFFVIRTSGSTVISMNRAWTPVVNTWYHVAIVKDGTSYYMFIDGSQIGTTLTDSGVMTNYTSTLSIGQAYVAGASEVEHRGWLDELRVSKGVARWTANFTAPVSAYEKSPGCMAMFEFRGPTS